MKQTVVVGTKFIASLLHFSDELICHHHTVISAISLVGS